MTKAMFGWLDRNFNWQKGIIRRFSQMYEDVCYQYYAFRSWTIPSDVILPPKCARTKTKWETHLKAFQELQNKIETAITCYQNKGQDLLNAQQNSRDLCNYQNSIYLMALQWTSGVIHSSNIAPRRNGGQLAPGMRYSPVTVTPLTPEEVERLYEYLTTPSQYPEQVPTENYEEFPWGYCPGCHGVPEENPIMDWPSGSATRPH